MDHFTLALTTGAVAGALDIIPMIAQKLSFRSCLSAFLQYFFAGPIVFTATCLTCPGGRTVWP